MIDCVFLFFPKPRLFYPIITAGCKQLEARGCGGNQTTIAAKRKPKLPLLFAKDNKILKRLFTFPSFHFSSRQFFNLYFPPSPPNVLSSLAVHNSRAVISGLVHFAAHCAGLIALLLRKHQKPDKHTEEEVLEVGAGMRAEMHLLWSCSSLLLCPLSNMIIFLVKKGWLVGGGGCGCWRWWWGIW